MIRQWACQRTRAMDRGIVGETPEKQKFGILPPVMDTTEVSGRVGLAEA